MNFSERLLPRSGKQEFHWIMTLFVLTAILRLIVLFQSRFAFGADGYYYAAQLKYLFTKGYFFSPDSSLMLYLMAGAARIGTDIIVCNKIVVALAGAAVIFPTWRLCRDDSNPFKGIIAGLIMVSGTLFVHFTFDYVKNLGGILLFLILLIPLKNLIGKGYLLKRYLLCILLFVMILFTHKLMAGIAAVLIGAATLRLFAKRWKVLLLSTLAIAALAFAVSRFAPGALAFADFSRIRGLFSFIPQAAPISYLKLVPLNIFAVPELLYFIFGAGISFVLLYRKKNLTFFDWLLAGLLLFCINPFFRFTGDNLAFRFFLLLFIPGTILAARMPLPRKTIICIAAIPLLLGLQTCNLEKGRRQSRHDYALYHDLLPLIRLPKGHLLIVHHGFDYFYCFNGKGDAFHFLPEKKHFNRPLYRLAYGVSAGMLKKHGLETNHTRYLPGGYTLMQEKNWNRLLEKLNKNQKKKLLTWKNPHIHRPGYMLENDRFLKE